MYEPKIYRALKTENSESEFKTILNQKPLRKLQSN